MVAPRQLESTHGEGLKFVALCGSYCGIVVVVFLAYAIVVRTCQDKLMIVSEGISRLLARKHFELQAPLDIACLGLLATPAIVFIICIFLGPFVAFAEKWSPTLGIEYMIGNTMGMTQPLTDDVPSSPLGIILAVIISAIGLLLVTLCLGVGQSLVSACRFWEFSTSIASFLFWVFGFNLAMMALLSLLIGSLLSAVEGWALLDGYKFAVAQICQFPNSLTEVAPVTGWGNFIEVLCISLQVLVQSVALDTISTHPVTGKFIDRVKQKGVRMRAGRKIHVEESTAKSAKEEGVTETEWKKRVLDLESKLKEVELREAECQQQAESLRLETKTLQTENSKLRNEVAVARGQQLAL
mmetsp:Transcript_65055/g.121190  ORF Transcript_65055/g.121190 Transcript_65055/m.121190 type:complete len:354 (+) Transcript_65055:49-1110(+)